MSPFREYRRRSFLPLAGLALAAYFFFALLPLGRRAQSLDAPLQKAWQKLAASLDKDHPASIDFLHVTNQLAETKQAQALLESAKQKAMARLELGPAVRAKMNGPFQLVDYENERSKQM